MKSLSSQEIFSSSQEVIGSRTDKSNFTVCRFGTLINCKLASVTGDFLKLLDIGECYLSRLETKDVASCDKYGGLKVTLHKNII